MIIGIAGQIASGKSTLGRALAARLDAKLLSFGAYVRHIANEQGIDPTSRQALQEFGQKLVDESTTAFVENILTWGNYTTGQRIIFDGIRHEPVWLEIVAFARRNNDTAKLIFLEIPEQERQRRLAARGLTAADTSTFDKHASERDLGGYLRNSADLRLKGQNDTVDLVETIIRTYGSG